MKKILLYVIAVTFLMTGCTSKEQDEQISSFWQQQMANLFTKRLGRPMKNPDMTPERLLLDKDGKPFFPQEEQPTPEQTPEKQTEQEQPVAEPEKQEIPAASTAAAAPAAATSKRPSIKAFLFVHSDSPDCKRLRNDKWDEKFQQKFPGSIILVEYDMKNPASKAPLQEMMRKHKLSTITVPILFIGDQVLQGYPFEGEDQAAEKAFAAAAQAKPQAAQKRKQQSNQYMEIIMEDSTKAPKKNTRASAKDTKAIQLALASVEKNNQATLSDMGAIFGEDTKAQAYVIISRTERLLRNKALSSPDYKTYLATQKALLQAQEKELNQLMRQNAGRLRSIRG